LINIAIIVAAEMTGDFFLQTGLIHIIALLFLLMGISRIFVHYNAFDPYLRPLTLGAVAALLLFSFSHLTEYLSLDHATNGYSDELYVDVTNLYMTAMLLVAFGAQLFLAKRTKSYRLMFVLLLGFCASLTVTVLGFMQKISISLEPDEASVYVYTAIVIGVSVLSIHRMFTLGKTVSIMRSFAGYISAAFFLVTASALHYLLYEILEHLGMPELQIIYVGHFLFYAALSLIFLAFPRLAMMGGIYPKK
jgi:hypothetical protein